MRRSTLALVGLASAAALGLVYTLMIPADEPRSVPDDPEGTDELPAATEGTPTENDVGFRDQTDSGAPARALQGRDLRRVRQLAGMLGNRREGEKAAVSQE